MTSYAEETFSTGGSKLIDLHWVKDLLSQRYMECEVARLMAYNVAYMQEQGLIPTKEASISKVFGSETLQKVTNSCLEILGPVGTLKKDDPYSPLLGRIQENWMISFSHKIAAGTSEVQRNIIAGRGLELPRG